MWKYAETIHHILYFLLLSLSNELLFCPLYTYQSLNDGTCNILILLLRVLDLKDLQLFFTVFTILYMSTYMHLLAVHL